MSKKPKTSYSEKDAEKMQHGFSYSRGEKLDYVRRQKKESLFERGEYENALLKEMDLRDSSFCNIMKIARMNDRKDMYIPLLTECLSNSGFVKIGGALWVGSNGYYQEIGYRTAADMIFRCMLFISARATDAMSIGDAPLKALEDNSDNFRKDVVRFRNCFYVFGKGVKKTIKEGICLYGVDWSYKKNTKTPLFDKFLVKILPDVNDRLCVQEFFGMTYIDRNKISIEKFLMMIGNGANGKSVLLNIVSAVIGRPYISHLDPSQLKDYKQIATMEGKKMNIAPDVRASSVLTSALKTLVSGEKVEAWKMYFGNQDIPCPPLVFSMNEMPRTEDKSNGMIRRMLPVFFGVTIPEREQDKELANKIIESELSGVFDWMMEGRNRLLANKGQFTQSIKSLSMSTEIIRKSVPIIAILEKAGLHKEPAYIGQQPVYMRSKEIIEMFDLQLVTSAAKISKDLIDSHYAHKLIEGYNKFIFYNNEDSER